MWVAFLFGASTTGREYKLFFFKDLLKTLQMRIDWLQSFEGRCLKKWVEFYCMAQYRLHSAQLNDYKLISERGLEERPLSLTVNATSTWDFTGNIFEQVTQVKFNFL